jgi:N-methylhydantoinase A
VSGFRVSVDIGGTFTDIVIVAPDGTIHTRKVLSTPEDYSRAIEEGLIRLLEETGVAPGKIGQFAHGTTVATNAIIERKGARVALVTTKGFRDVLELGRFRSPRLYDLSFRKPEPLVERRLRFELRERISASGAVLTSLDHAELGVLAAKLKAEAVEAVAICFLNSYVNDVHEIAVRDYLAAAMPEVDITASVDLLPQIGEYERTSTTVVNAYLIPTIRRYIEALNGRLSSMGIRSPLAIMQSGGNLLSGRLAAGQPVRIIESGPAAGVVGAAEISRRLQGDSLLLLDIGGTTAKAAIIQGGLPGQTSETEVGGGAVLGHRLTQGAGYVVQVPTIDLAEVGAGGGSIARVNAAGGIEVGPSSAGAMPGPACYNQGGTKATVTDANLLLGYLSPDTLVGGDLALSPDLAEAAIGELARKLNMSLTDTAYGIHLIANATMMRALVGISSERGLDPAAFTLFAIGGNGSIHGPKLAEDLGIRRIVVPPAAGVFSALGMLLAKTEHQLVAGFYRPLAGATTQALNNETASLLGRVTELLVEEGYTDPARRALRLEVEAKYSGQTATLSIPVAGTAWDECVRARLKADFDAAHRDLYNYASEFEPLQLVALKVSGRGLGDEPGTTPLRRSRERTVSGTRSAYFGAEMGWREARLFGAVDLREGPVAGPAIMEEYDTTIIVRPGVIASRDALDNVILEREEA